MNYMAVGEDCSECDDGFMQFVDPDPHKGSKLVCANPECDFEALWNERGFKVDEYKAERNKEALRAEKNKAELQAYARTKREENVKRSEFIRQTAMELYEKLQAMVHRDGLPESAFECINMTLCNMVLDLPETEP